MKRIEEQPYYGILEMDTSSRAQGIRGASDHGQDVFVVDSEDPRDLSLREVSPQGGKEVSLSEVSREEEPSLAFTGLSVHVAEETTHYRGKTLKQVREGMGIDLKTVSSRIKVNAKILELIEEEVLEKLPPLVYLKGFLKSYARCLGLNPQRVVEGYLQFSNESKKKK